MLRKKKEPFLPQSFAKAAVMRVGLALSFFLQVIFFTLLAEVPVIFAGEDANHSSTAAVRDFYISIWPEDFSVEKRPKAALGKDLETAEEASKGLEKEIARQEKKLLEWSEKRDAAEDAKDEKARNEAEKKMKAASQALNKLRSEKGKIERLQRAVTALSRTVVIKMPDAYWDTGGKSANRVTAPVGVVFELATLDETGKTKEGPFYGMTSARPTLKPGAEEKMELTGGEGYVELRRRTGTTEFEFVPLKPTGINGVNVTVTATVANVYTGTKETWWPFSQRSTYEHEFETKTKTETFTVIIEGPLGCTAKFSHPQLRVPGCWLKDLPTSTDFTLHCICIQKKPNIGASNFACKAEDKPETDLVRHFGMAGETGVTQSTVGVLHIATPGDPNGNGFFERFAAKALGKGNVTAGLKLRNGKGEVTEISEAKADLEVLPCPPFPAQIPAVTLNGDKVHRALDVYPTTEVRRQEEGDYTVTFDDLAKGEGTLTVTIQIPPDLYQKGFTLCSEQVEAPICEIPQEGVEKLPLGSIAVQPTWRWISFGWLGSLPLIPPQISGTYQLTWTFDPKVLQFIWDNKANAIRFTLWVCDKEGNRRPIEIVIRIFWPEEQEPAEEAAAPPAGPPLAGAPQPPVPGAPPSGGPPAGEEEKLPPAEEPGKPTPSPEETAEKRKEIEEFEKEKEAALKEGERLYRRWDARLSQWKSKLDAARIPRIPSLDDIEELKGEKDDIVKRYREYWAIVRRGVQEAISKIEGLFKWAKELGLSEEDQKNILKKVGGFSILSDLTAQLRNLLEGASPNKDDSRGQMRARVQKMNEWIEQLNSEILKFIADQWRGETEKSPDWQKLLSLKSKFKERVERATQLDSEALAKNIEKLNLEIRLIEILERRLRYLELTQAQETAEITREQDRQKVAEFEKGLKELEAKVKELSGELGRADVTKSGTDLKSRAETSDSPEKRAAWSKDWQALVEKLQEFQRRAAQVFETYNERSEEYQKLFDSLTDPQSKQDLNNAFSQTNETVRALRGEFKKAEDAFSQATEAGRQKGLLH